MPVTTAANAAITEAQFEAQLRAAILAAFPWLPAAGLVHQKSFTFWFGKATVTANGDAKSYALARADVLVSFQGEPLAIFELKRPGLKLTADDQQQGLSYARLLQPQPPLVVVSNGQDVWILETDSGEPWRPASKSQAALKALITRGVQVAAGDLKRAVDRLMGADPAIWAQAVRQATAAGLDERTGDWDEPVQPFVRGYLMPRKATHGTMKLLEDGHRLIMIEGGPLVGKSNVLRELAQPIDQNDAFVFLYLDADVGLNLFERVALTHNDDGSLMVKQGGHAHVIEPDEDEPDGPIAFDDFQPYLILSHLAGHAFEVVSAQTTPAPRADPDLLVGVGSVPMILRRPEGDPDISAVPAHDIESDLSVVCHRAGIVEPITWSLVRFFSRERETMRDQFIDFALNAVEPALLPRLDIALRQTSESADAERAAWARAIREDRLKPLLGAYFHA